jgi:hypothetical protein
MATTAAIAGTATVAAAGTSAVIHAVTSPSDAEQAAAAQQAQAAAPEQADAATATEQTPEQVGLSEAQMQQLQQLAALKEQGVLTAEEFDAQKAKILAST